MQTLRTDPTSWSIERPSAAAAALEALEILGLVLAESFLHRYSVIPGLLPDGDELALRGLGTYAGRIGMSRLAFALGRDEHGRPYGQDVRARDRDEQIAGEHLEKILRWLFVWPPPPDAPPALRRPTPPPPAVRLALDELHSAALYGNNRQRRSAKLAGELLGSLTRHSTRRLRDGR